MSVYYLHDGKEQSGPFTIEELRLQKLNPEIRLWSEGMEKWKKVSEIEELNGFLLASPPPFTQSEVVPHLRTKTILPQTQKDPKRTSSRSTLVAILVVATLIVGYFVYQNYRERNGYSNSDYGDNQRNDLIAGGNYNIGLFGQKTKIHGNIRNVSSTEYQSATVKITFMNKNSEEIGTDYETVYDVFPAHASKNFELVISNPKGTKSISMIVSGAGK